MSLRNLEYGIVESLVGIRRNPLMSFASITTIGLSLTILGAFVLLGLGINNLAQSMLSKYEFAVYTKSGLSEGDLALIDSKIRNIPQVASVELVTAEAGWEKVKQDWNGRVDLTDVQGNPIPDSFRVKVDNPRYTARVASTIREMSDIDEVIEAQQIREFIVDFADLVKLIGGTAAGVLFLVMAFIISNTIRLTVYARRREIGIMQLVGATNWFIRMPLLFEGIILGAIGGGLACLLVFGGSHYIIEYAMKIMPMLEQVSSNVDPYQFYGSMVILGGFAGMIGSLISIRRFLKARAI